MNKKNSKSNSKNQAIIFKSNKNKRRNNRKKRKKPVYQIWDCSPERFEENKDWEFGFNYVQQKLKEKEEREKARRRLEGIICLVFTCLVSILIVSALLVYVNTSLNSNQELLERKIEKLSTSYQVPNNKERDIKLYNPVINNYYLDRSGAIYIPKSNQASHQTEDNDKENFEKSEYFIEQSEYNKVEANPAELEDSFEESNNINGIVAEYKDVQISNKDLQEMKAIARAEGGHNAFVSQQAVAVTILERASNWDQSIHQVISTPGQYCTYSDGAIQKLSEEEIENASASVWKAIYEGTPDAIMNDMRNQAKKQGLDLNEYAGDGPMFFCSETDGTSPNELEDRSNIKVKAWDTKTGLYFYRYWDK